MDTSYGIGIANRYALFMGDEDQEPGSQPIVAPAKGKENKATIAPKKVPAAASSAPRTSAPSKPAAPATGNKTNAPSGQNNRTGAPGQGPRSDRPRNDRNQNDSRGPRPDNQKSGEGNARGPRPDRPPREPRDNNQGGERPQRPRIVRPSGGPPVEGKEQGAGWPSGGSFGARDRENHRTRDDRPPRDPNATGAPDENRPFRPRQDRGPREGRGGGRGGRRFGDNRDGRGKPVFDRHSGSDKSGVKSVEKKEGAGSFNWGTPDDELAGQNATEETAVGDRSGDETAPEQTEKTNGVEETKPEEPEVKEYTLDEWKKMQKEGKKSQPSFNLRKPNEGEDNAQWKKTYLLTKKKEEEEPAEEYEEITYEVETETTKRKKQVLDIDIKFRSENRNFDGRDRRGGRGGGRGGRDDRGPRKPREAGDESHGGEGGPRGPPRGGRGGQRGPRGRDQAPPKVDDINDFPTLVTA